MKRLAWLLMRLSRAGRGICCALVAMFLMAGCTSTAGGMLTVGELQTNVSWKMDAYRQAGIQVMYTENQRRQVSEAYAAYQNALNHSLQTLGGNRRAPAPPELVNAANQLNEVLDSL